MESATVVESGSMRLSFRDHPDLRTCVIASLHFLHTDEIVEQTIDRERLARANPLTVAGRMFRQGANATPHTVI